MKEDFVSILNEFADMIRDMEVDETAETLKQNFLENRFANMFSQAQVNMNFDGDVG